MGRLRESQRGLSTLISGPEKRCRGRGLSEVNAALTFVQTSRGDKTTP